MHLGLSVVTREVLESLLLKAVLHIAKPKLACNAKWIKMFDIHTTSESMEAIKCLQRGTKPTHFIFHSSLLMINIVSKCYMSHSSSYSY